MPELPDIQIYIESLGLRIFGKELIDIKIINPFLLRSVDPPLAEYNGKQIIGIERIGKRIVLCFKQDLFLVVHLMIAGRLRWMEVKPKPSRKIALGLFTFESGFLLFTEAGTKRRASLHAVRGREALAFFDRGGIDPVSSDEHNFRAALTQENHTLKRTLTDQRFFSGIGNSYSDEILHAAGLSPFKQSQRLTDDEIHRLHRSCIDVLEIWTKRLRKETGNGFPEKVTAFREEMAVHGKYGEPCPVCGTAVQRIRYAENESNYCPKCQTAGKLLADRGLSRLLKDDWPSTVEELEALQSSH
ncbi:MAG: formamidopyrimidine-DNA glycosylase [Spirochaetales bacterium]|jgi:formamidopyrimidine-DNA glycosylase|nr:formamidopyrimidine-DNA glycosylase [Spirochaetales bacterium]